MEELKIDARNFLRNTVKNKDLFIDFKTLLDNIFFLVNINLPNYMNNNTTLNILDSIFHRLNSTSEDKDLDLKKYELNQFLLENKNDIKFIKTNNSNLSKSYNDNYYILELYKVLMENINIEKGTALISNNIYLQDMIVDLESNRNIEIYKIENLDKFDCFTRVISKSEIINKDLNLLKIERNILINKIKVLKKDKDYLLMKSKEFKNEMIEIKKNSIDIINNLKSKYTKKLIELDRSKKQLEFETEKLKSHIRLLENKELAESEINNFLNKNEYDETDKDFENFFQEQEEIINNLNYNEDVFYYIAKGDLKGVQNISNDNINITTDDDLKDYALHKACEKGDLNIINFLIKHKNINIDAKNRFGWTALHKAVRCGFFDVIKILLKNKANKNIKTSRTLVKDSIIYPDNSGVLDIAKLAHIEKKEIIIRLLKANLYG